VRLIARANGARALLKLPGTFFANSSIVDLVTSGNRLAGVTSDGGFVVWEVPPMVDDDIPYVPPNDTRASHLGPPFSSLLLVAVPPNSANPYKSIKWHPSDPNVLALATTSEVHLINVQRVYQVHGGDSISQNVLVADAEVFPAADGLTIGSPVPPEQQIAAFAFDTSHNALATISQEGTLNLWAIGSQVPPSYQVNPGYGNQQSYSQQNNQLMWSGKINGEGSPSSLFFMDQAQGVVIGRKRNTVIQLVGPRSTNVQASVKFVHGNGVFGSPAGAGANSASSVTDEREFFAHLAYDPRIRCIWAASSHRASLMALRIVPPNSAKPGVEMPLHFEQILDFPILHPTISLGILISSDGNEVEEMERGTSSMDITGGGGPNGPGGEMPMALVAYVIHSGGVDQVLIGKQDLESASQAALVKLPVVPNTQGPPPRPDSPPVASTNTPTTTNPSNPQVSQHPGGPRELMKKQPPPAPAPYEPPPSFGTSAPTSALSPGRNFGPMDTTSPVRPRSPISDLDADFVEPVQDLRAGENNNKRPGRRGRDKKGQHFNADRGGLSDSATSGLVHDASSNILKEIQKVEENLQNKISVVVGKEFRDQREFSIILLKISSELSLESERRLEQMHEQDRFNAADFQERLVKNLSGELVKSTGRVFEAALKTEVQRTILPALEMLTRTEIRQTVDQQISRGISESMNQVRGQALEAVSCSRLT